MGFDLSRFAENLSAASESDAMLEIPVENIADNPKNFYPRPDEAHLLELMESIEANGLLEPPAVVPSTGGKYRLISGHSRMAAIRRLRSNDNARLKTTHRWDTVLCRVLEPMSDDAELSAVIEANRQRVKSPALLADEAERLTAVYVKRQEAGEALPGGIRGAVAKALQVNQTKISNLKTIKAGLKVPGIIARWERDELPEAAALVIARMDIDAQYRLTDWIIDNGKTWSIRDVELFDRIWSCCKHKCPETAGLCPHAEQIIKDKLKGGEFRCGGCCKKCAGAKTCKTVCDFCKPSKPETALPTELPECQTVLTIWMPGGTTPVEPGMFAVLVELENELHPQIMLWDGGAWTLRSGASAVIEPTWWLRLPPAPEKEECP